MDLAFAWLLANNSGAIVTEAADPYVSGIDGFVPACNLSNYSTVSQGAITDYKDLPSDETAMGAWLSTGGPISIGIDGTTFQTYTGGIITDCISVKLDHAVLAVGYDDTHNPPYWIIKNSWGPTWGESGYARVEKGTNQCLINSFPSTSIVGSATPAPGGTPAPWTPSPAAPTPAPGATPAPPSPSQPTVTMVSCADTSCSSNCQAATIPQNECVANGSGNSIVFACSAAGVEAMFFNESSCQGSGQGQTFPFDQCFANGGDGSVYFSPCAASGSSPSGGSSFDGAGRGRQPEESHRAPERLDAAPTEALGARAAALSYPDGESA